MKFSPEKSIFTPKEKMEKEEADKIVSKLERFFDEENFVKNGEDRDMEYFVIYRDGKPREYCLKRKKFCVTWEIDGKEYQIDERIEYVLEARLRFPDFSIHEGVDMVKKEHGEEESSA